MACHHACLLPSAIARHLKRKHPLPDADEDVVCSLYCILRPLSVHSLGMPHSEPLDIHKIGCRAEAVPGALHGTRWCRRPQNIWQGHELLLRLSHQFPERE